MPPLHAQLVGITDNWFGQKLSQLTDGVSCCVFVYGVLLYLCSRRASLTTALLQLDTTKGRVAGKELLGRCNMYIHTRTPPLLCTEMPAASVTASLY